MIDFIKSESVILISIFGRDLAFTIGYIVAIGSHIEFIIGKGSDSNEDFKTIGIMGLLSMGRHCIGMSIIFFNVNFLLNYLEEIFTNYEPFYCQLPIYFCSALLSLFFI